MSNYGGCFNVTDRRNHPGGGLVKNVTNVHGKQTSYITTYPPAPVPRERIREELVRYSAPTFTSDVLGQQGATFMQPGESSYMTQFRNYSQIKNLDRAKPLSINKSMTRNCPAPGGTCNILTHDGQVMRIFENKSQSAPSHPFDTVSRIRFVDCFNIIFSDLVDFQFLRFFLFADLGSALTTIQSLGS